MIDNLRRLEQELHPNKRKKWICNSAAEVLALGIESAWITLDEERDQK